MLRVDLEEIPQCRARVAPPEAVGAQCDIAPPYVGTNEIGDRADVVAGRHNRSIRAFEALLDPTAGRATSSTCPLDLHAVAPELGEGSDPPDVCLHVPAPPQELRCCQYFAQDRSAAEQLNRRVLSLTQQVHALQNSFASLCRN